MWSAIGLAAARSARVGGTTLAIRTASRLAARNAPVVPSGFCVAAVFARGFAAAKDATESATTKKKAATKKPAAKKKTAAKKETTKPKAVLGRPRKEKKVEKLTDEQKLRAKVKQLRIKGLFKEEKEEVPQLPATAWTLYIAQRGFDDVKGQTVATVITKRAGEYKSLPAAELEELNVKAAQNKAANEVAIKKWMVKYTPAQIRDANIARLHLRRLGRKSRNPVPDDRIPTKSRPPLTFFMKERLVSSDLAHLHVTQRMKVVSEEWAKLSAAEREPFVEKAELDKYRWRKEMDAVNAGQPSV